jgi:hypothetical protein
MAWPHKTSRPPGLNRQAASEFLGKNSDRHSSIKLPQSNLAAAREHYAAAAERWHLHPTRENERARLRALLAMPEARAAR